MSESNPAEVIAAIGTAFEAFKATHAQEIAELKAGSADFVTSDKLKKLNDELDRLTDIQDRLATVEKRANRPGVGHNGGPAIDPEAELKAFNLELKAATGRDHAVDADGYAAYKSGFNAYLRKGDRAIGPDEFKAMSVGSDPDGGYLVTPDVTGRIVQRVYDMSPIRQIATVQPISTDALEGLAEADQAGAMVMVGENTAPAETATPQMQKWRIPVFEGYVEPRATQQLLEDSAVDVEAWLAKKVADRIARGQNAYFVTGTGVMQPKGFTQYTVATTSDDTRAWGQMQYVPTGVSGDFAASDKGDIFFDLIAAFRDAYLQNARFVTRREVIAKVRKFKATSGDYLWQPGLQQGQPQTLLGFPVTIAQDMPAIGANSLSLAFGDFAEGYQIVDRLGLRTIRDNLTSKPYVKFYTRTRFGGGVVNFEAIKFLKFAAS